MADRVLVVDDEEDLCRLVSFQLRQAGFDVQVAQSAADALLAAARQPPLVVVLDLMLPDLSGIEVCKRLRADDSLRDVGILMLTAMSDDEDRVTGLEAGADDYVTKPFNVREIVLRVQALARRIGERQAARGSEASGPSTELTWRDLRIDTRTHDSFIGDEPLALRPLEFKLLVTLLAEPGKVFTRDELLKQVWELEAGGNPRTVDVHVRRLRQNLRSCSDLVETVPGFGYRARPE